MCWQTRIVCWKILYLYNEFYNYSSRYNKLIIYTITVNYRRLR